MVQSKEKQPETFPQLLLKQAERLGFDKEALREKEFGIWQAVTWSEYLDHVKYFCLGLVSMGLEPDDAVVIVGDNRPEWVYAELAAQSARARSVGVYPDSVAEEVFYIADFADAKFIVVEDQEQVDKVLEIWDRLSGIEAVIYYDPKGLRSYDHPFLMTFPDVETKGRDFERENPGWFEDSVDKGRAEDTAILCTTSGTTAKPKLAMLTHSNLLSMGRNLLAIDPRDPGDEFVSFLPLAWIGEQMMSLSCGLMVGFTVNFPEETETVQENIREIGPKMMFSPPRIWENMLSSVQVKMEDSTWFKRLMFNWALPIGHEMADVRFNRQAPSFWQRFKYRLADILVFQMVKDQLGMRHTSHCYTGGAALGPDVFRFFHALGINLKQIYGQTEVSGISVVHRDKEVKFQTVGIPIPETEVKISEDGEILTKSPAVFTGYYNMPEETESTLRGGWLYSGDAGYYDQDGQLIVIDRVKDVMTLQDGTKFSPQFVENKLKFSLYIREAVVFGGGDWPFVTAMINIDSGPVGKWAETNHIGYTTFTDLSQKRDVYDLVRKDVVSANKDLPSAARISRFILLHKELDSDDEELTRTRKVRRGFIAERYNEIVDALYGDEEYIDIDTTITYQDGRTADIKTHLFVTSLEVEEEKAPTA